ncbi:MAG: HEAT repeat domain-containing protein [Crocinitomicaceae bacterium]|nr:HEAT repeat domain-containing protein [Crocinitomicaceae bacterium]
MVRIRQMQQERNAQAIIPYLSSKIDKYRETAALAMASIQNTSTCIYLTPLLGDLLSQVRIAAGYALGQYGNSSAKKTLCEKANSENGSVVIATFLESIGKLILLKKTGNFQDRFCYRFSRYCKTSLGNRKSRMGKGYVLASSHSHISLMGQQ